MRNKSQRALEALRVFFFFFFMVGISKRGTWNGVNTKYRVYPL